MAKSPLEKQLEELDKLRARDVLTAEEYQARRAALVAAADAPVVVVRKGRSLARTGCLTVLAGGAAVIVVVVIAALAAGGSKKSEQIAAPTTSQGVTNVSQTAVTVSSAAAGTNKGDVHVVLANGASGEVFPERNEKQKVRVTLVQFVDNAPSSNQFSKPADGKKFVAFEILVENIGTAEATGLDWKLRDTGDFEVSQSFSAGVGGPSLPSGILTPGGKTTGWVVFEIGKTAGVKWLRADPNPFLKNDLYFDGPAQ